MEGKLQVILDSDDRSFFGHGRLDPACEYFTIPEPWDGRDNSLQVLTRSFGSFPPVTVMC